MYVTYFVSIKAIFFLQTKKAATQIIAESAEPSGAAMPMGKSVWGYSFAARYAPGILTQMIEITLWIKEMIDFPIAQKYPLKEKWIAAKMQSKT